MRAALAYPGNPGQRLVEAITRIIQIHGNPASLNITGPKPAREFCEFVQFADRF